MKKRGYFFGIIGLSGAGKSTLIRCLNYLERPTSGNVYFNGVNLADLNKKRIKTNKTKILV
ncbi:MAG: ATP-binding cassette domain-containing protein [Clostridium sp.]|nr:MAG: ATP-binding cassette domain-containing protein [Clostridium sp.]